MALATEYPAGAVADANLAAGDVLLTGIQAQGIVSKAIKLGCRLRGFDPVDRRFSHAALVISDTGDLAEAQASGVRATHILKYHKADYLLVRIQCSPEDRLQIVRFATSVLAERERYGYLTFAGLALYCLTGARLCLQTAGTAICSGFVADALTRAGFIWPRPPYAMMPADLSKYFRTH